ncbi:single-stranded DNA-binding protein, mitochondrial [Elaeis guineensis]|uniref:Single-stranded DNA-binding protein, mitochondrial n=1 Tax=Elaeis guineensis var. tenera TaxID=51953 RepID=A0A6I9RDH0_ELAGV|nr:single-stranded DNA-binding protein, mitochondrial [Elaeis guineensis]
MASSSLSSFASLSRRLISRSLLPHPFRSSARFFSSPLAGGESDSDDPRLDTDQSTPQSSSSSSGGTPQQRLPFQRPLENGLDPGVYKAILVGKVGQRPVQKQLKSGRTVVLFSLGTGGIRNNRRPLDNEQPREYADRCAVQWHRVCLYAERLGDLALKHVKPGSVLYLEGNLETKVFSDPITGLVRRIREIAIRRDGRLVFLGNDDDTGQSEEAELRGVGYH